jgi:hypothetical protein
MQKRKQDEERQWHLRGKDKQLALVEDSASAAAQNVPDHLVFIAVIMT